MSAAIFYWEMQTEESGLQKEAKEAVIVPQIIQGFGARF